jgi:hypothetical protein
MKTKLLTLISIILLTIILFNIYNPTQPKLTYNILSQENNAYNLEITQEKSISKILIKGSDKNPEAINANLIDYIGKEPNKLSVTTEFFAVKDLSIKEATLTLAKKGNVDAILKCHEFNENLNCLNWETTDIPFKDLGDRIEFTVNTFSGYAGAEILAIDAEHLDKNYNHLENIYNQIKTKDNTWSNPIQEGEIIRVTFEKPLTNENMIDVHATSEGTVAYFEIFEAGTNNKVGRSQNYKIPEHTYIPLKGLTKPTDTFDFKIQKLITPQEETDQCIQNCITNCNQNPDEEPNCEQECETDCQTITTDENRQAYLTFDYIHDATINETFAEGIIVYSESTINTPRYRFWNASITDFNPELTDMTTTGGDTKWSLIKSCPTRDEMFAGTETDAQEIYMENYNSSGAWDTFTTISSGVPNTAYRAFDFEYEPLSGDLLIAYENSGSNANNNFSYRVWNGSEFSAETEITTTLPLNAMNWIELIPQKETDIIMALIHTGAGDLYAVPWNGTNFDQTRELTLSTATSGSSEQHFAFAWEESSGQGIVSYGESTDFVYRTYDPVGGFGGTENTITLGNGNGLSTTRMCSEENSDYIGIIFQDSGNDVQAWMWDGTQILASPPTQEDTTEANGAGNINLDCVWLNSSTAMFGFTDLNALSVDYFNFTKSTNTWGITTMVDGTSNSGNFASDDIKGMRFYKHPKTEEVMVITEDIDNVLSAALWNGSEFNITIASSPLEATVEAQNGASEDAYFSWFTFDQGPTVTIDAPTDAQNFNSGNSVNISATITDNTLVDTVLVNITYPNSSTIQFTMINSSTNDVYNYTFTDTSTAGTYTIRIIANDSLNNVNDDQTITFVISTNAPPNVTAIIPTAGTSFNFSDTIQISVNVTDGLTIPDTVQANITYPNGSSTLLALSNTTFLDKYNNTFTIPVLIGTYNITFIANDTDSQINNTETTNFTVVDSKMPYSVVLNTPTNNSNSSSTTVNFNWTAIDNYDLSLTCNITIDSVVNVSNIESSNGTSTNYSIAGFTEGTHTWNITCIDNSSNTNTSITNTFTIDTTNPSILIVIPPNNTNTTNTGIDINYTTSDTYLESCWYSNDTMLVNTTLTDCANLTTITWANGQHNITIWANDSAGNENSSSITLTIDAVNPQISITTPSNNTNSSNTGLDINYTTSDASNCWYSNDSMSVNTTLAGCTNLTTITWSEGPHNVTIWVNDSAGNENSSSITFTTDTTLPTIDFTDQTTTSGNYSQNAIWTNITASDTGTAIDTITIYLYNSSYDLVNSTTGSSSPTYTNFTGHADGTYYLNATANDTVGNENNTATKTIILDTTAPTISLVFPSNNTLESTSNEINLTYNVTDATTQIQNCSIYLNDALTETDYSITKDINQSFIRTLSSNNYTWGVNCTDSAGNIGASTVFNLSVSLSGPTVTLIEPPNNNYSSSTSVTFNCSATDNSGLVNITLSIWNSTGSLNTSNTTNISGTSNSTTWTIDLEANTNFTWNCKAYDDSDLNDIASSNRTLTIDTINPTVSITTPPNNTNSSNNGLDFNFTSSDTNLDSCWYSNDTMSINTTLASCTNLTTVTWSEGQHNVTIWVNDSAGNINSTTITFTIDSTNPQISITTPTNNTTSSNTGLDINYTKSDTNLDSCWYSNDSMSINTTLASCTNLTTITWSEGQHNVTIWVNDSIGNENSSSITFTIDSTNPSISITTPTNNTNSSNTGLNINYTAPGASSCWYSNDTMLVNTTLTSCINLTTVIWSEGQHNLTIWINDSIGNENSSSITFTIDTAAPSINFTGPSTTTGNQTQNAIWANITASENTTSIETITIYIYNSSFDLVNSTTGTTSPLFINFTELSDGTYYLNATVNDSAGNLNNTETITITIDSGAPTVTLISPSNNSWQNNGSAVFTYSATDTTLNNCTLYGDFNTTWLANETNTSVVSGVQDSINVTLTEGNYKWNVLCYDDSGNSAFASSNNTINIDTTNPDLSLNAPTNNTNSSSSTVIFNWTATDNLDTNMTCNLTIDSIVNATIDSPNNTLTNYAISGLSEGSHLWNLTCTDNASNSNTSETRNVTIDISAPTFITLTTDPSTAAGLDLGTNITVMANLSENITSIETVILQRKLSTESNYTNITMILNSTDSQYYITFNATDEGTYNLRLWTNDSAGNAATSTIVNKTIQQEKTWTRSPTTLATSGTALTNTTLGNLTINNTGDITLTFNITSNSTNSIFNDTGLNYTNFSLAAGTVYIVSINDTAPSSGIKNILLNISTSTSGADPSSQTSNGIISSTQGQPLLVTSFIAPAGGSTSVTQGDKGVAFVGRIQNLGTGNASNVTLFYTIADDWTLTFGTLNTSYDEFTTGDEEEIVIEVEIPSNASNGTKIITINATGVNASGSNLYNQSLIISDSVNVTVINSTIINNVIENVTETVTETVSGGGGGGGSREIIVITGSESATYNKEIEVVRGEKIIFTIDITNNYTLKNLNLEALTGFLSQYITIKNNIITKVTSNQTKSFEIELEAPIYKNYEEHSLQAIIKGKLLVGNITKDYTETQNILLIIQKISREESNQSLNNAKKAIQEMKENEFNIILVERLLNQSKHKLYIEKRNWLSYELSQDVIKIKDLSFEADDLIQRIKKALLNPKLTFSLLGHITKEFTDEEGKKVNFRSVLTGKAVFSSEPLEDVLEMAETAFERGDYESALERAEKSQVLILLERKGNFIFFLYLYWPIILFGILLLSTTGIISYRRYQKLSILKRIQDLNKEEENITKLTRETQTKYFTGKISVSDYNEAKELHDKRRGNIKKSRINLRNQRIKLLKPGQILKDLKIEKSEVEEEIKKLQTEYYLNKKITENEYKLEFDLFNQRLAEIEGERATIEILEKQKQQELINKNQPEPEINNTSIKEKITPIEPSNEEKQLLKETHHLNKTIIKQEINTEKSTKKYKKQLEKARKKEIKDKRFLHYIETTTLKAKLEKPFTVLGSLFTSKKHQNKKGVVLIDGKIIELLKEKTKDKNFKGKYIEIKPKEVNENEN